MTASPSSADGALGLSAHSGLCSCPVCTGTGLSQIPTIEQSPDLATSNPLSSLPALSSNPGATAKLYLDFNGHFQANWGSYSNASTPVFDQDGNASTFSNAELATIQEVWARVSEDYAPFNIDVTTIAPGSQANGVVAHIAIGGNWSDWFGEQAGGVAYIGGFYNSAPNVGYVFEAALGNGNARYVAEAASHEAGHLFGLYHQAKWNGTTLVEPYNSGTDAWAPIMGVGYYSTRTTWHNGTTDASSSTFQNDMAILANSSNGFGYRADDHVNSGSGATPLSMSGSTATASGRIGQNGDQDMFRFTTGGGTVNLQLNVSQFGANLDTIFQIWSAGGQLLASASPAGSLGASLSKALGAGTYYVAVRATGGYGNVGRYSITGTVPQVQPPEIGLSIGGTNLNSGDTVDFGQTTLGAAVTQTITVHNTGTGNLSLTQLTQDNLPAGFELISNLGSTLLAPGATTTFEVRLAAADAGAFSGNLQLASNDGDENPFVLVLTGQVTGAEITVLAGGNNVVSGQTVNFGASLIGSEIDRTFTIVNTGTDTLTLAAIDPLSLPAGFTLVSNLGSTTLLVGESTTFVVRLDCSVAGAYSGQISLTCDDANEDPFTMTLAGVANPPVRIIDNGAAGNTRAGTWARTAGKGFEQDIHSTAKGTGSRTSSWTFNGLASGQYNLWASWTGGSSNATNAPFQIFSGGATAPTVRVNQRVASSGLTADGWKWKFLGTVNVTKGWVVVKLTNAANGVVVADALRLAAVPPSSPPLGFAASQSPLASLLATSDGSHAGAAGPTHAVLPESSPPIAPVQRYAALPHSSEFGPEQSLLEETLDLLSFASRQSHDELPEFSAVLDHLLQDGLQTA